MVFQVSAAWLCCVEQCLRAGGGEGRCHGSLTSNPWGRPVLCVRGVFLLLLNFFVSVSVKGAHGMSLTIFVDFAFLPSCAPAVHGLSQASASHSQGGGFVERPKEVSMPALIQCIEFNWEGQ